MVGKEQKNGIKVSPDDAKWLRQQIKETMNLNVDSNGKPRLSRKIAKYYREIARQASAGELKLGD